MISIDPGVKYYACAYWSGSVLVRVRMAHIDELLCPGKHDLVLEKPQVYKHARARSMDLVNLAMAAMRVACQGNGRVFWYLPREWKGQVPKNVHQDRIRAKLTENEASVISGWDKASLKHILDAVGLGLYRLGRLRP